MKSDIQHHILIVEGDKKIKQAIASLLADTPVIPFFCDTGEAGMDHIKKSTHPMSLIISALSLSGMDGAVFLETAKKTAPHAIRYLMAASSQLEAIIGAVNQRAVHRFFVKPFDNKDFLAAVRKGLNLYESIREHKQLLELAKQQNEKLYDLNCKLVDIKKAHNHTVQALDHKIQAAHEKIATLNSETPQSDKELNERVFSHVDSGEGVDVEKLEALFAYTAQTLFDRFEDLAHRSGFEMPDPRGELE